MMYHMLNKHNTMSRSILRSWRYYEIKQTLYDVEQYILHPHQLITLSCVLVYLLSYDV